MNPRGLKLSWVGLVVVILVLAESGCRRHNPATRERIPPRSKGPALYGLPTGRASTDVARLRPPRAQGRDWRTAPFYLLQTELSPAILVHSSTRQLSLFAGATNSGLGAPTFVAWTTMNGPRTFRRGEPLDVTRMEECWVLVWWAGAEGWTYWDSPWVIFLQHKPQSMILDGDGLHLEFAHSADDVVLLPLYGYEKTPQKGSDFPAEHGLRTRKVKTWEWAKGLPRDPLTRVRYWA